MTVRLSPIAFATSAAVVSAVIMLLLGILGNIGVYTGAVEMMMQWHLFFSLSITGIIAGMVEAIVIAFVFCYGFAWLYNALLT